jgi:Eukaryotic aspartyl protease
MIHRVPISRPNHVESIHPHRHRRLTSLHRELDAEDMIHNDINNNHHPPDHRMIAHKTTPASSSTYAQFEAYNCDDIMYTGTLLVGTPPQSFNVKIDTSTSISWIPSVKCDQTCHFYPFHQYNSAASSTYNATLKDPTMSYTFHEVYPEFYYASVRFSQFSFAFLEERME